MLACSVLEDEYGCDCTGCQCSVCAWVSAWVTLTRIFCSFGAFELTATLTPICMLRGQFQVDVEECQADQCFENDCDTWEVRGLLDMRS